ncbi:MAG: RDD family protein, partial [Ignavibacteriae bacterium]|nr:RDD family protein [Ignavibacteriota bacterium]
MNEQSFQPPPPPLTYQQPVVKYAGFWKRFAAILIDKLIIAVASLIILLPFIAMIGISAFITARDVENIGFLFSMVIVYILAALMIVIAEWLYFAIMESQRGATIGKMVLNIVVTDLQGHRITFGRA